MEVIRFLKEALVLSERERMESLLFKYYVCIFIYDRIKADWTVQQTVQFSHIHCRLDGWTFTFSQIIHPAEESKIKRLN